MLTYSGNKPFGCTQCNNTFTIAVNLKTHVHSFRCEQCSYSCRQSSNLKYHMLSHTGEKSFACNKCNHSCKQSIHLKRHMTKITPNKWCNEEKNKIEILFLSFQYMQYFHDTLAWNTRSKKGLDKLEIGGRQSRHLKGRSWPPRLS